MGIGTMRVPNHDTVVPATVWPMYPHRDIEGITHVVPGHFEHAYRLGNEGMLEPGGAQRMTLAPGAEHSERNHSAADQMQFIQMGILPNQPQPARPAPIGGAAPAHAGGAARPSAADRATGGLRRPR
jgi:redox-sensitive bicupin YhaK (pirin superfamily)